MNERTPSAYYETHQSFRSTFVVVVVVVAVLLLVGQTWRPPFGLFERDIIWDALIG